MEGIYRVNNKNLKVSGRWLGIYALKKTFGSHLVATISTFIDVIFVYLKTILKLSIEKIACFL